MGKRLLTVCLSTALALPFAAGAPDLSGSWTFDRTRSDDIRASISAAAGSENTQGGEWSEFQRVWIRGWLMGVIENPESRTLTIKQTDKEFQSGLGDELSLFYFGRKGTSRGPSGGNLTTSVEWKEGALVTEEKSDKDKGRIAARYVLDPDGSTLRVTLRIEHKALRTPLEIQLVFARGE